MQKSRVIIFLYLFLGGCIFLHPGDKVYAQTKKKVQPESISSLKDKEAQVKKDLKKLDENISKNHLNIKQTLSELDKLNNDIKERNELIEKQTKEITAFNKNIEEMNKTIKKLEEEYDVMKQKYVDLIYHAYLKNNSYNRLLFVLSASSFQESYRRFIYLQQFASLRKQQAEEIEIYKKELNEKKEELEKIKLQAENLLSQKELEQELLLEEKKRQDNLISSLQKREKELKQELEKQQKIADQLNKKIQELIEKEAQEAEKRRKAQAATKGGYAMTKEEKVIAGGFEKNKGLLMWPVQGKITGKFGVQPHPVLKNITIENKGIYITAQAKGAEAAVVYDGVVTQCFSIPGSNNAVIVRHGNYLTVYANLTTLYVKAGDKVSRGKKLGKIYEDADNRNQEILLFQVRKEKDILNPQDWLRK
jgi:septal ring factor EnvC (AmiA/AmiB activator)